MQELQCEICSKAFKHRWSLLLHRAQYHSDSSAFRTQIQCTECARKFSRRDMMESHVAVDHAGEDGDACAYCRYVFSHEFDLDAHEDKCRDRTPAARIEYLREHFTYDPALCLPSPARTIKRTKRVTFEERDEVISLVSSPERRAPEEEEDIALSAIQHPPRADRHGPALARYLELGRTSPTTPLFDIFDETVTAGDLLKLEHLTWLNDTIVDAIVLTYYHLVCTSLVSEPDRLFCAKSVFMRQMRWGKNGAYENQPWFAKLDVLTHDWAFFPVLHANHWSLLVVHVPSRTIEYADSLRRSGAEHMQYLERFLCEEEMRYRQERPWVAATTSPPAPWILVDRRDSVPQQDNSSDCGVFMCETARLWMIHAARSDVSPSRFDLFPRDIPRVRRRMQLDLIRLGEQQTQERAVANARMAEAQAGRAVVLTPQPAW